MNNEKLNYEHMPNLFKGIFFAILVVASVIIGVLDYYTSPLLNLHFLYLAPITLAAWRLGRPWALTIVLIDMVPTYLIQLSLVRAGLLLSGEAAMDVVVRVAIYAFVAEMVHRLVKSRKELRDTTLELQQAYDLMEQDLSTAGLLQASVLRNPIPQVTGLDIATQLIYARETGGDFREVVRQNGYLHMTIGDVTGKSVPAALFTALLKHLLEEGRSTSSDPRDIVDYVNTQLGKRLPDGMFISLFYGRLHAKSRTIEYVNAGHEPGLVYDRASDSVKELGSTQLVTGLREYKSPPETDKWRFRPGDIILLYTDGVTDAKMKSGERLGPDFIKEMLREHHGLSADEILDRIVDEVRRVTTETGRDDIGLVCVKMLPRR